MRASLGKPLTIENVTGAGGTIDVGRVARALPDGYTNSMGISSTHVVNAAIYNLHYDVVKDFEPIALLANSPVLILAKNAVPANDLTGLIAWLKANADKALFGTASVGSPPHIAGVLFPTDDRHAISLRALSRRRSNAPVLPIRAARASWQHQGLCRSRRGAASPDPFR
jgi:tripartite-type tricarboxylate transporter receptor subunit TctC